jgi:membrane-associated phospholipid phosphatase
MLGLAVSLVALAWPPAPVRELARKAVSRWPRAAGVLLEWYPLLLVPLLYTQLHFLIQALHGGRFFDGGIQQLEQLVFGGQPSRDLAAAFPIRWLSELLHAGYLSYYLIIYLPPLLLFLRGGRSAFREAIFSLLLAFVLHYLVFIYFPVQGPRYLFPPPAGPPAEGVLYGLTHRVLEAGSSQGAAFPSSHVGVAVAQLLIMYRFHRRLTPVLAVLTLLLAVGAVYGGFHYGIDALCGAVLGGLAVLAAPAAYRLLGGDWRGAEPAA